MIRVLICDDQEVVREGWGTILSTAPSIQVVGTAQDGAEAVYLVEKYKPDIVLMDLNMPVVNGIEATRQIYEKFPTVRVLALTTYETEEWVIDAIRAGAVGYLLKDTSRANSDSSDRGNLCRTVLSGPSCGREDYRKGGKPGWAN